MHLVQQRGVEHGAAERPGLVERGGEGDQAVAADARRRWVCDRRCRSPRRAGGSSRRCRCRWPAAPRRRRPRPTNHPTSLRGPGTGPTGCGSGGRRSSRWRSPSRTRPCWSCRASPCRPRGPAGSRWRRRAGSSPARIFEPEVVGRPLVTTTSFIASGTPASGPSSVAGGRGASSTARAAARAPSVSTCRKARTAPSTSAMRSRCAWATSTALASPEAIAAAVGGCVQVDTGRRSLLLLPEDPRHAEPVVLHGGRARAARPRAGGTARPRRAGTRSPAVPRARSAGCRRPATSPIRATELRMTSSWPANRSSSSSVTASRASRARWATSSRVRVGAIVRHGRESRASGRRRSFRCRSRCLWRARFATRA